VRVTLLTAALILVCSTLLPGQESAPKAVVLKGKQLFSKYGCYECHGTMGQGTSAGARLAPKPIALPTLIAYVRGPKGQMPPYTAKVVSDAELADIRAYLASIPEPPAAKSIPLLNQE
jgi:ubiquinol-cytochrome c reductase cytochrome c subunit